MKRVLIGVLFVAAAFATGCAETEDPSADDTTATANGSVHQEATGNVNSVKGSAIPPAPTGIGAPPTTPPDPNDDAPPATDGVVVPVLGDALGVDVVTTATTGGPSTDVNVLVGASEGAGRPSPEPWADDPDDTTLLGGKVAPTKAASK